MESFPPESPECYGLHTNAEIAFRLDQAKAMFEDIQQLQVRPLPVGGHQRAALLTACGSDLLGQ